MEILLSSRCAVYLTCFGVNQNSRRGRRKGTGLPCPSCQPPPCHPGLTLQPTPWLFHSPEADKILCLVGVINTSQLASRPALSSQSSLKPSWQRRVSPELCFGDILINYSRGWGSIAETFSLALCLAVCEQIHEAQCPPRDGDTSFTGVQFYRSKRHGDKMSVTLEGWPQAGSD